MRLRSVFSTPYHAGQRVWRRIEAALFPRGKGDIHSYWRAPDEGNAPVGYVEGAERSAFLVRLLQKYATPASRIIELGCNVGRNLNALKAAGFEDLSGIEINPKALTLMRTTYPGLAESAKVSPGAIEEILPALGHFDCVYTMAVLMHIHPDSEAVIFDAMSRQADLIVVIEDEVSRSWRGFPRNYRRIFEARGFRQVEEQSCANIPGLNVEYVARVFLRR